MSIYHLPRDVRSDLLPNTVMVDTDNDGWTCFDEFGPHNDHESCQRIFDQMSAPYPDEMDYSGWYGGEQGYQDGLRWSDFV